jgi:hypothetical protein
MTKISREMIEGVPLTPPIESTHNYDVPTDPGERILVIGPEAIVAWEQMQGSSARFRLMPLDDGLGYGDLLQAPNIESIEPFSNGPLSGLPAAGQNQLVDQIVIADDMREVYSVKWPLLRAVRELKHQGKIHFRLLVDPIGWGYAYQEVEREKVRLLSEKWRQRILGATWMDTWIGAEHVDYAPGDRFKRGFGEFPDGRIRLGEDIEDPWFVHDWSELVSLMNALGLEVDPNWVTFQWVKNPDTEQRYLEAVVSAIKTQGHLLLTHQEHPIQQETGQRHIPSEVFWGAAPEQAVDPNLTFDMDMLGEN